MKPFICFVYAGFTKAQNQLSSSLHYNEEDGGSIAGGSESGGIVAAALPKPLHNIKLHHKNLMAGHMEAAKQSLEASFEDHECDPFDLCPICAQIPSTQLENGEFSTQLFSLKHSFA